MSRNKPRSVGGIIHTYQKYDPKQFPSPTEPPTDVVSSAFDHMMMFGSSRRLSEEELARAIRIDPSQIGGLGPSIDALIAMLLERKRKILERFETETVQHLATDNFQESASVLRPPRKLRDRTAHAIRDQQLYELERIWYAAGDDSSRFARDLVQTMHRLGEKYEVDELSAKYEFTGVTPMTVPEALAIKEELEKIDELLKQLEEARETAQIAIVDMEALSEFADSGEIENLEALQQMVQDYVREMAERQGLEAGRNGFELTPKAYRTFQSKLLERIFSDLQASRTGRHQGPVMGEGASTLR